MDDNILLNVKRLAALMFQPEDIAEMLELDKAVVKADMLDDSTPFYKHFKAGYHETEVQLRKSVVQLATSGSGPAQAMLKRMMEEQETRRLYG